MSRDPSTKGTNTPYGADIVSRRKFLVGTGALATLSVSGAALADATAKVHDHITHSLQHPDLLNAVNNCIAKGQDKCREHEEKHRGCKDCAEACADVVAGAKKTFNAERVN